jgi:hypothetical protein
VRRALVAPAAAGYGLARMYETLADSFGQEIRVFRALAEACAWLDVPPEGIRERLAAGDSPAP